jgi:hypothetical protein
MYDLLMSDIRNVNCYKTKIDFGIADLGILRFVVLTEFE